MNQPIPAGAWPAGPSTPEGATVTDFSTWDRAHLEELAAGLTAEVLRMREELFQAGEALGAARADLDKTAADVLAVIEGRDPETWAWPLHGLRDALDAARAGRDRKPAAGVAECTPEQSAHFVCLVREMRRLQRKWFGGDKSTATLHDAKKAEKAVDRAMEELESNERQGGLF